MSFFEEEFNINQCDELDINEPKNIDLSSTKLCKNNSTNSDYNDINFNFFEEHQDNQEQKNTFNYTTEEDLNQKINKIYSEESTYNMLEGSNTMNQINSEQYYHEEVSPYLPIQNGTEFTQEIQTQNSIINIYYDISSSNNSNNNDNNDQQQNFMEDLSTFDESESSHTDQNNPKIQNSSKKIKNTKNMLKAKTEKNIPRYFRSYCKQECLKLYNDDNNKFQQQISVVRQKIQLSQQQQQQQQQQSSKYQQILDYIDNDSLQNQSYILQSCQKYTNMLFEDRKQNDKLLSWKSFQDQYLISIEKESVEDIVNKLIFTNYIYCCMQNNYLQYFKQNDLKISKIKDPKLKKETDKQIQQTMIKWKKYILQSIVSPKFTAAQYKNKNIEQKQ